MRILAVHPHDPTSPAEPWTVRIINLARELRKLGHEVRVVCFRLPGWRAAPPSGVVMVSRAPGALLGNSRRLLRWAKWADVVHLQKCFGHAAVPALCAAYLRGKPIHYDWDDWEEGIQREHGGSWPNIAYVALTERILPKLVDTVSVSSAALAERCRRLGVRPERISHVPVGADLKQFAPTVDPGAELRSVHCGREVVLYVGQLHGSHDAPLLLKAARNVLRESPTTCFLVVGEGGTRPELQRLTNQLGLERNVSFTGSVAHSEVPRYLALADVTVASLKGSEAAASKSPLKIAEYMAAGKAVVCTDVGEAARMVSGCGKLVPPGDAGSLGRAILEFLNDPDLRAKSGQAARRRAEETYNWTAGARTLEHAYRRALGLSD
jgi:glycosyltransferase involved in cell wall biosynthesis